MDLITLTTAKAYTDKKASGGAEPVVIDLDEWGIDVASLTLSGGGKMQCNVDHDAFWKPIPVNGNFIVKAQLDDIISSCLPPSYVGVANGQAVSFGCSFIGKYDRDIMAVNIIFNAAVDNDTGNYTHTEAIVIVEQKSVPGL